MLKTLAIQDKHVASLTAGLEEASTARDHAQAEVEQLKAYNQQLLGTTGQDAATTGMLEFNHQLDHANQQLASRGNASSTEALVEQCKELEEQLQLSNQRLQETCSVGGMPMMQNQLTNMAGERDVARKRVQELLDVSQTLTAQPQELKVQLATTTTEYESQLRVASFELETKQKQYEREAEFAQGQMSEVERLRGELKEVRDEFKTQKSELDAL